MSALVVIPEMKLLKSSPGCFKCGKTRDSWTLVEDVGPVVGESTLSLFTFVKDGKECVSGDIMVARAKEAGTPAGQYAAECMLEQQQNIPVEWRKYNLVFTATQWCDSDGRVFVPSLDRYVDKWYLFFYSLGLDWGSSARVVLCE